LERDEISKKPQQGPSVTTTNESLGPTGAFIGCINATLVSVVSAATCRCHAKNAYCAGTMASQTFEAVKASDML
jgi:hypothetical protein